MTREEIPTGFLWGTSFVLCGIFVALGGILHQAYTSIPFGILMVIVGTFEILRTTDNMRHPRRPSPETKFTPPPDP